MAELKGDTDPARGSTGGTPRWVKVFVIIAIIAVVLVVILLLSGGGHGPSRHMNGGLGIHTPSSSIAGVQQL